MDVDAPQTPQMVALCTSALLKAGVLADPSPLILHAFHRRSTAAARAVSSSEGGVKVDCLAEETPKSIRVVLLILARVHAARML